MILNLLLLAIWRGGTPIGIAVQEYFAYHEVETDHIAVRTSSYTGIGVQEKQVKVHGLHYLIENIHKEHNLLIVDDVFDSGRSIEALIHRIQKEKGDDMPTNVRIACPYYKPQNNRQHSHQITTCMKRALGWYSLMNSLVSVKEEIIANKLS